jgi:chromosome segregation ATPase
MADEELVEQVETSTVDETVGGDQEQSQQSDSGAWPADVQAEFTKKTQALADERRQWENDRFSQQQQMQQYQQQLQQYANQMQQSAATGTTDPAAAATAGIVGSVARDAVSGWEHGGSVDGAYYGRRH